MKKRNLLSILALILPLNCTNVMAIENPTISTTNQLMNEIVENNDNLKKFDTLIVPNSLMLDDEEIPLYVSFENQQNALQNFRKSFSNEIDLLKHDYNLEEISENNYNEYYSAITSMIENNVSNNNISNIDKYNEMLEFIDIFENKYQNDEISDKVTLASKLRGNDKDDIKNEISLLTPNYNEKISQVRRTENLGMPNLNAAINYAKKYATSPNPLYTYFSNADCTNFVSQILNNGGVGQVVYSSKSSGWWYKTKSNYSYSWTVANTFSKYMGRTRYNVSWNTFKGKLKKGSFIGKDNTDDGDVNHMAFITDVSSDKSQVQIAQHTTNYLKWSNSTGWTNIGSKAVYYLVR